MTSPAAIRGKAAPAASAASPREWRLRRNCALRPNQLIGAFGCTCAVVAGIGAGFWVAGYPLVAGFAAIEALALAVALVCCSRHVADGERITLQDGCLTVERQRGQRIDRFEFPALWVRVRATSGADSRVVLSHGRHRLLLGEQVPVASRHALARELRAALRQPPNEPGAVAPFAAASIYSTVSDDPQARARESGRVQR